jgi:hypothetical protein
MKGAGARRTAACAREKGGKAASAALPARKRRRETDIGFKGLNEGGLDSLVPFKRPRVHPAAVIINNIVTAPGRSAVVSEQVLFSSHLLCCELFLL